jgi:uncharacterized protein (DUF934 family)
MVLKTHRAEVRLDPDRKWNLWVPDLDLRATGQTLLDAEQKMRRAIADKFQINQEDICLELQDHRGIVRERARRISHPAIRI